MDKYRVLESDQSTVAGYVEANSDEEAFEIAQRDYWTGGEFLTVVKVLPVAKIETILCAAIWVKDGKEYVHQPKNIYSGFVLSGWRHHNCITLMRLIYPLSSEKFNVETIQGFLTSGNRFVDRPEAATIAFAANQIDKIPIVFTSENLY